jgi:hypothetical protein
MDALSSAIAMKVSCDLQLTLMASSLYRLLGKRLANGYATAKSQQIFRDFSAAVAHVMIDEREITERFQKHAHNPLALAAGFAKSEVPRAVEKKTAPAALRVAVVCTVRPTLPETPFRQGNVERILVQGRARSPLDYLAHV